MDARQHDTMSEKVEKSRKKWKKAVDPDSGKVYKVSIEGGGKGPTHTTIKRRVKREKKRLTV